MITVLLQQILDLLSAHFPGVITLLEKLNLIEPDVEEIREDVDVIRNTTNMVNSNIQLVYIQSKYIKDNTDLIKTDTANISSKTDLISNNIGTISTNTGRAASFAEDCANNTLDIDQKITTIASDTTQIRSDNQTLISNTNDIESYLLAMAYGLVKTTAANGNPINFNTDLIEELPIVRAEISPIQAGSGTPAPDNVRNISGISNLDIVMNGDTESISLGETVYRGDLDVKTGSGSSDLILVTYDGSEAWGTNSTPGAGVYLGVTGMGYLEVVSCNRFEALANGTSGTMGDNNIRLNTTGNNLLVKYPDALTAPDFITYLQNNPLQVLYRKTPSALSTTPATFTSVPGDNQISANANADLTITYKESVANYIANNT